MPFSDESYDLRIELDQQGCELSADQIERMETALHTLRKLTQPFPVANLYIDVVFHKTTQDFHLKTSLALPGKTLFTGDRDADVQPAFERCVRKLVHKVSAYKSRMEQNAELAKQAEGTHHRVESTGEFDVAMIQQSVDNGDYSAFRQQVDVFAASLRQRIGRWLQRYPEIESRLGSDFGIGDIVEEVFLNAFENFEQRSHDVPPGDWLTHLIDPSVQTILKSPDEEYANLSFVQSFLNVQSE
jgi:ribosome-associated translation inhibitor RaiA